MPKSILLDGTERRLFEQQIPGSLDLNIAKDGQGDYVDPSVHGMYIGFLMGHMAGISQGLRIAKAEFEVAYTQAASATDIASSEVGTSAGLGAIDLAIETSDADRAGVADSQAGLFKPTLMTQHGEIVRTMALEQHLAAFQKAS